MNYERPELLEKLAGSYVLGTMGPRARPRFARLLAESTRAQRAVAQWNNELAPLYASVPPMRPPADLWQAIAAKTAPGAAKAAAAANSAATATAQRGWWRGVFDGWGRSAVAFGLGAVLTAGVVMNNAQLFGLHKMNAALPASYVGILSDAQGQAALTAGSHRHGNTMKIKLLKPLAIPAGKVARLWALSEGGAPSPLTNVPASGDFMIQLDTHAEDVFRSVSTLAVSFESDPAAKAPSLPYVLSGHCVKFW